MMRERDMIGAKPFVQRPLTPDPSPARGEGSKIAARGEVGHIGVVWLLAAVGAVAVLMLAGWAVITPGSAVVETSVGASVGPIEVFAGIPPLANLVERIGKEHVRVGVLVQPGQDPHVFEPTPRQVMALSHAVLFFKIGLPFENQLVGRIAGHHPRLVVVDVTEGIAKRTAAPCCEHGHCDHDHDGKGDNQWDQGGQSHFRWGENRDSPPATKTETFPEHDHEHAGEPDPHVWLAPRLLKVMAVRISEGLCRADPAHADEYRRNQAALAAELDALHERIARRLAPYRGQAFYVFHPAFGYFGDEFGLKQESVEIEGKSPTPRQLRELIGRARADGVRIIFLQPQFDQRSATAVARAIDGAVLTMDSLAPDVLANLDDVAEQIARAREKQSRGLSQFSPRRKWDCPLWSPWPLERG